MSKETCFHPISSGMDDVELSNFPCTPPRKGLNFLSYAPNTEIFSLVLNGLDISFSQDAAKVLRDFINLHLKE